ncbi:MAG: S8 family serine peptidase [Planctomycetaceae bacterium]|nr:S8 family serine peptidase [Planctomycetaceae bacterium]
MSWMPRFLSKPAALAAALVASAAPVALGQDAPESIDALPLSKQILEANPDLRYDPTSVLVRFSARSTDAERSAAIAAVDGKVLERFDIVPGLVHLSVGISVEKALLELTMSDAVDYAEPDWVRRADAVPNDPSFNNLWGMRNIGQTVNNDAGVAGADSRAHLAWDVFTGDPNFVIAVIDDGTNNTHPDLAANIWSNPGETAGNGIDDDGNGRIDDTWGWDFYSGDNSPYNTKHGTHTAGTVGAVGNNGVGVAGVMWRCKIMALRFLGQNGGYTSDAILCVQYMTQKGVKVSNNSWGGGGYSQGLYDAINATRNIGHVFVASAGNSGVNSDTSPAYPGAYNLDNIINVAATDNNDGRASFSNYGASSVDIGAPGVNILSTYGTSSYSYLNGTSMAGPHVAGAAALVYAANPNYTYTQVKSRILSTARPVSSLSGRCVTGGVLDVQAALGGQAQNTAPTVTISSPANNAGFAQGSSISFSGSASDTQDGSLTASLSWSSSLQGALGTGGSFSRSDLVLGTHTITASATDSGSLTTVATVVVTVSDPGAVPPAAPSGVSVTGGVGSATVRWTDNSANETGFEIKRQTRVGNSWSTETVVGTVGANVTEFVNSTAAGKYRYAVRAVNASGASAWTAWVQVTVN